MIGSGQNKFNDTISSSSSECAPLCQRCSSEDANLVCINCGNIQLCSSCDDLIHSTGIYESHKRVSVDEFETSDNLVGNNINAEIEIDVKPKIQNLNLSEEAQAVVDHLKHKLDFFTSKNEE